MGEPDTAGTDHEHPESPKPTDLPSVTVSRGLIGIPEALRFWRWHKTAAAS